MGRFRREDRGAVTVELALALPVLVAVVWAALWAVGQAGSRMACVDAARSGARAAARGESPAAVTALVSSVGLPGARVEVLPSGRLVTVRVVPRQRRRLFGRVGSPAGCSAVAQLERTTEVRQ